MTETEVATPLTQHPARAPKAQRCRIVEKLGGDSFLMGGGDPDGFPDDREGPIREVHVEPSLRPPAT